MNVRNFVVSTIAMIITVVVMAIIPVGLYCLIFNILGYHGFGSITLSVASWWITGFLLTKGYKEGWYLKQEKMLVDTFIRGMMEEANKWIFVDGDMYYFRQAVNVGHELSLEKADRLTTKGFSLIGRIRIRSAMRIWSGEHPDRCYKKL